MHRCDLCFGKILAGEKERDSCIMGCVCFELQATHGAFYLAVQPGRMAFSWHAILVTGHLAFGPGIFGSLCVGESPHPPNSYFTLSLSLTSLLPKDNCSALCGLAGLFIATSWPWLVGRQCHDSLRRPHNYTTQSASPSLHSVFFAKPYQL